jgi:hypothetical protein
MLTGKDYLALNQLSAFDDQLDDAIAHDGRDLGLAL